MFRPLSLFIGFRYSRAKRRNHFISFFSLVSIIGIALGVTVLITVLSVMNGFDQEIRKTIFSAVQHVTVFGQKSAGIDHWESLEKTILSVPNVTGVAPYVRGQGVLSDNGTFKPILVNGILPAEETKVSSLMENMIEGSLAALKPGQFGIVIGQVIADELGLTVGDKITIMSPTASVTPVGVLPRTKRFTIVGVFHYPGAFRYDSAYTYIHLNDAQRLYQLGSNVTGINVKVNDLYNAIKVSSELTHRLPMQQLAITDWTAEYGDFFKAMRMEKTMMFILLVLLIFIALFNVVSSLVTLVTDKRSEIAIMRTIGAKPIMILMIFIFQGFFISLIGVALGVLCGCLLALNVTSIVSHLQQLLKTEFVSDSIYFIDYLPSRLMWSDIWHIMFFALGLGLIATIYPAWSASKTQPAEALRYE